MGENEYKVSLGVDIDLSDIQTQINTEASKVKPKLKVDVDAKDLANKLKTELSNIFKGSDGILKLDTKSIENALGEVKSLLTDIKGSIGSIGSDGGLKNLLSSVNQIAKALGKAEDESNSLVNSLNALSKKDFSINFGINMGSSNQISRNAAYGQKARRETLPELQSQVAALEGYLQQYYKVTDGFVAAQKLVQGSGAATSGRTLLDIVPKMLDTSGSLSSQMSAYKEYIALIKDAASLKGVDLSHITSQFSKSADQLVQDAVDVQTGAKEMEDGFEKLKQIFGGGNNFNVEGLSEQLDSIVNDLREIKNAIQDLSKGIDIDEITQSFKEMSAVLKDITDNLTVFKNAFGSVGNTGNGLGSSINGVTQDLKNGSNILDSFKQSLKNIGMEDDKINKVANRIKNLGVQIETLSQKKSISNGRDVLTVDISGIDKFGNAVKLTKEYDIATGDLIKRIDKVSTVHQKAGASADTFAKQQKRAVTDLTNQIDQLNRAAIDQNAARPIKQSDHLNSLKSKYDEIVSAIERMGVASRDTFEDERNKVKTLIGEYKSLKSEYKNAENVALQMDGNDFASGLEIAKNNLAKFKAEAQGFSQLTSTIKDLDRAIEGVGDVSSLKEFNNQLRVAKSELSKVKTETSIVSEIRIRLADTGFDGFEQEVARAHAAVNALKTSTPELQAALKQLDAAMKAMTSADEANDVQRLSAANKEYEAALRQVYSQLKLNQQIEKDASKDASFEAAKEGALLRLRGLFSDNSEAAKRFGAELDRIQRELNECGDTKGLTRLNREITNLGREIKNANVKTQTFSQRFKKQWEQYTSYFSVASLFSYAYQGLRDMFQQVVAIDTAMTELKKVTDETDASYNKFLSNAAKRSKEIGTTIDGLVKSTADFARLGYGFKDAQGLAEVANIYAVVGDEIEGVEGATESLISTMAAFKNEMNGMSDSDFAMNIVDKFNEIGNNFAISSGGIGEALERSASSLNAANNTLDESIALITAANTVVQDPTVVGTAFKTISMRIRGAKTELEEAGLETDGMVESTATLRAEMKALSGVDIMEADGKTFKSTYAILDELAQKWGDLSDIQQATITELIAGKRQGNIVSSLMTNFDTARDALETSLNSSGSALKEHAKYSESLEFRLNKLKASWQAFAQTLMDSDALKAGIDLLSGLVNILEKLVDTFGTLGTVGLGVFGKVLHGAFQEFKGLKEAKKTIADVANGIEHLTEVVQNNTSATNVAAQANEANAAAEMAEAEANATSATTEAAETKANMASVATETAEAGANATSATTELTEAEANAISTAAELAETEANITSTVSELTEAEANTVSATSELAEAEANTVSTTSELAEATSSATSAAAEAAETTANLTGAVVEAGAGAAKAAGGIKAFFGALSTGSKIALGVTAAIAVISLVVNAVKKAKEEAAALRQETIEASNEFLDSANTFEKAYIKYSGKTDLTVEEEAELEAAINGTVDALGDKSSALKNVVNGSNDYVASLKAIADAELKAANTAAKAKRDAAEEDLEEAAMGWSRKDGSEVNVVTNNGEAIRIFNSAASEFYKRDVDARGNTTWQGLRLNSNADTNEIIDYYYALIEVQEQLSDKGLSDTIEYENVTKAINKMSEAVRVYTEGAYEAAKAQYQLSEGIPKTTEEYLRMREAILNSEDIKGLSLDAKNTIANGLDSEYKSVFDLSSVEAQARKLVGVINKYGDGTIDGTNDIGTMETFLNMRTAVNNNECSIGEYLAQFDEIEKITENYSDEEKELLNTTFGLDTDAIKAQYDEMEQYLSRKNPDRFDQGEADKKIEAFLNDLTADELAAVIDIRTEIDWENTSAKDIRKQIEDQVKLNEALNFSASIEVDKTALEALNTALEESASAMGLSEESIDSLKAKYSDLEGYNPHTLFEKTANGVKVNREELAKLEQKYNDLTKTEVQEHLDTLVEEYNKCTKAIDGNIGSQEKLELISKREKYAQQIEELAEYQAQLEGVTGAYQRWINAQNTPEDYEGYQAVATSREDIEDEIGRGFISNATKEYIDLLSGEDLVGGTIDDYANAWEKLDQKVGSTSYSIHDFFTVNDDGDITSTGIDRFFKGLQQDFKGEVAKFNEKSGKWEYDFSQENLQKIQDEWGIGIEAIELLLEAAASAGYDVDWGGMFDDLDIDMSNFESVEAMISLAEKAQEEFNALENIDDVEFNFRTNNIQDATTEVEKARKAYIDLITNDDGSLNLKAEGAEQMQFILATLLTQKQQLSTPAIMKVDTSQIDKAKEDVIGVVNAAQTLQTAYENYEIAITTGVDVESAKADLNSAIEGMRGTSVDVRADLKLPTDEELTNAANGIGDIKVGASLDGTSIGAIATKIQTECTPEVIAKVTGLDETAIQNGSQQVVYTAEHSDVDNFINGLSDISKKIIYTYTTEGTKPNPSNIERSITYKYKTEGDVPEVNGTANVNGTTQSGRAFVRGNWGIKGSGTALVGELGMETLVRGGHFYTIGDSGAEFIKYKQGDIIFNHKQTEELFKNGKVTSDGGRGRMYANGSAFANGSYPSSGEAFWEASASTSSFAAKRLNKKAASTVKKKEKTQSKTKTRVKDNTIETTTKTTFGATATESDFSQKNAETSEEKLNTDKFEETFDWVAIAIERIEREIDNLDKKVNNTYKSWTERNTALASEIAKVGEEITLQNNAASEYLAKANAVGLDSSYIDKIQNGTLNIEDFEGESDEALVEKIKEYQKWYELYLDCTDAAEDLKQTEAELYAQRFENVQSQYDAILQGFEHTESMLNEYISQAEAKGHIVSKEYYEALIDNEKSNIAELQKEQSDLIAKRDEAVANGAIVKGSQAWYDMCAEIDSVTQAIEEGTTALIEYDNAIRDIDWQVFDLIQERIADITAEADFLIDLMSYDKLFDDDGKLTDKGMAIMGLHGQNYNTYMYQADDYGAKVKEIDAQIADNPYDQELINKRREYIELQRECILNAEDEKQAIVDLVEEGINLELDALQERIDKHNEELDSMKDLYDYQKKVKEQTEEIASLEKQMAAYSGDDSEEAKAKVQELKVSLEDAKENLQESEYDKYISDQSALLDSLYEEYELVLNERLGNVDALLNNIITEVNSSATTISNTLTTAAANVGTTLSEKMQDVWNAEGAATKVVGTYGDKLTTTNTTLDSIKAAVNTMAGISDTEADTNIDDSNTDTSAGDPEPPPSNDNTLNQVKDKSVKEYYGVALAIWNGKYGWGNGNERKKKLKEKGFDPNRMQSIVNELGEDGYIHSGAWIGKYHGIKDLSPYHYNKFASGARRINETQFAWTQENGQEFIVRPSDGAILTPIAKGDSVLTSAASNNIWDMANSPAEFIKDNLSLGATNVPNNSNVSNNTVQHFENITFSMPNVKNYEQLLSEMQKDKSFEKLILAMTIDRIAGKSSLAKGKSIR